MKRLLNCWLLVAKGRIITTVIVNICAIVEFANIFQPNSAVNGIPSSTPLHA